MKDKVALFFDSVAENWDKTNKPASEVLELIADIAGISENKSVLDVGCGTGVMLPLYIKRNSAQITAVDISQKMIDIAERKYPGEKIRFVCGDITSFSCECRFDCVVVHNAFPHFLRQKEALENLKCLTAHGGTLTVAHSISRDDVLKCHANVSDVSVPLPQAHELCKMFGSDFEKFTILSDEKCYVVSATRKI